MKRVAVSWSISFHNASYKCPLMERTTKPCWWKETSISLSGKKFLGFNNFFRIGQSQNWIVGPGYSFVVFSTSRFAPPALSSIDPKKRNITDRGIHVRISSLFLRISFYNCYFCFTSTTIRFLSKSSWNILTKIRKLACSSLTRVQTDLQL